ncbi:MAG TPA: hypothetical protein VGP79_06750 [Bryobacteraceae bacterium]|jgi:hypothetical protein|nr:hypothetical protein [Bryobacteraceae bacterium]
MSFDLGVWQGDTALSDKEAAKLYVELCEGKRIPTEHPAVEAFYRELCSIYPEIDTLPADEVDNCPWSIAHDRSGSHVLMCMVWSRAEDVAAVVMDLAVKHGLICFDPQATKVYLPPNLKPKRVRFRLW